ncbi:ClbS/DfsB family four-helix bundle protein [Enterococcus sp. LJL120]
MGNRSYLLASKEGIFFESNNTLPLFWLMGFNHKEDMAVLKEQLEELNFVSNLNHKNVSEPDVMLYFFSKNRVDFYQTFLSRKSYIEFYHPDLLMLFKQFSIVLEPSSSGYQNVGIAFKEYLDFYDNPFEFLTEIRKTLYEVCHNQEISCGNYQINRQDILATTTGFPSDDLDKESTQIIEDIECDFKNKYDTNKNRDLAIPVLAEQEIFSQVQVFSSVRKIAKSSQVKYAEILTIVDKIKLHLSVQEELQVIDLLYYLTDWNNVMLKINEEEYINQWESYEILDTVFRKAIKENNILEHGTTKLSLNKIQKSFATSHQRLVMQLNQEPQNQLYTKKGWTKSLTTKGFFYATVLVYHYAVAVRELADYDK